MENTKEIVFHFLNPQLYKKFIHEISVDQFLRCLKNYPKTSNRLFSGYRPSGHNFALPAVQTRIEDLCVSSQTLRNCLCIGWLEAKKLLFGIVFESLKIEYDGEVADLNWFPKLKELQNQHGYEETAAEMVRPLIWKQIDHDEIRILISILSAEYEDQESLERYVNKVMDKTQNDPVASLDDLLKYIEQEEESIEVLEKEKQTLENERNTYKGKLDQSQAALERERAEYDTKLTDLGNKKQEAKLEIDKLESALNNLRKIYDDFRSVQNQLEQKGKKEQKKVEYEQNTIREEINSIGENLRQLDEKLTREKSSVSEKLAIKERLEQQIIVKKQELKEKTLTGEGLNKTTLESNRKKVPRTISEIREEIARRKSVIGCLNPLRKNDIGVVATPSTLDILERLLQEEFNPPLPPPSQPESAKDADGYANYWAYRTFWTSEKWDDIAISKYSLWRSRQIFSNDAALAAELALSGIYHAEQGYGSVQDNTLLVQFLCVIGDVATGVQEQKDCKEAIEKLLTQTLEQWDRQPRIVFYLGQLALISQRKLDYLFEIADNRTRIVLKRILARSFEGLIDFDEHDPSHEITHLIASVLEEHETRLRAACGRWLLQDSVDSIAQNARHELMASLGKFPDFGRTRACSLSDEFEQRVSAPLSKAIRSGDPRAFENLALQCFSYSQETMKRKSWVNSVYLWPCIIHLAEQAMEANIQSSRLFRAALEVSTDKQFYPLNVCDPPCSVEVVINNQGNTEAKDLNALIMPSQIRDDVELIGGEFSCSALKPLNPFRHTIQVRFQEQTQACALDYILNWKDASSMEERSQTGTLKLLSQKEVDWDNVQNPYSLKSIKEPARLKGRSDVLNILRRSRDSMDSYYITGQRRIGKSSVAQVYHKELNEKINHAAMYLYWGDLGTTELAPICHAICCQTAETLRKRVGRDDIAGPPSIGSFKENENFLFKTFFRDLHNCFPALKLFIIIDDFDELPPSFHETPMGDRFFVLLRALLDQEFIALYLIGSEKLPEILKRQGERLNLNQRCEIDYLKDTSEVEKIIIEPAVGVLEFDREAIEEIKRLSAGNPYYTTLICSRLFNDMARVKDYYISRRDVEKSVKSMVEEDALSTYQHFWKDGVFLPGKLGERQQYHNAKVLIALSRACVADQNSVLKEDLLNREDLPPLSRDDAEYALNGLLDRKVVVEEDGKLQIRVPLFTQWLAGSGARAVERSFAEAGLDEVPTSITRGLSNREIISVAQDCVYQERQVNEVQIGDWLSQFGGGSSQILAFKLLKRLREDGYFNQATIYSAFKEVHKQIISIEIAERNFAPRVTQQRDLVNNIVLSYLDTEGKSGHACQYAYRKVNRIHSKCAIAPDDLINHLLQTNEKPPIIFVDDIVGTGGTITEGFKNLVTKMKNRGVDTSNYQFYLAAVVGTKAGIEAAETSTEGTIRIMVWREIDERLKAFSEKAGIFTEESDRQAAKNMVEEIGRELESKHPLGRDNGELLVLFQHGCPNNTLPIFYKSGRTFRGREWRALFPR